MTPIRRQYLKIKDSYPDAIVLFRLGDFYETFDDDARLASRELEITLTSRSMGKGLKVPMAGVPAHSVESYLARLIQKGHQVAICEQLTDPSVSKGLVDRDVVRVVTPGTVLESSLLEHKVNNYLAAVAEDGRLAGLAYVDITTGEFAAAQMDLEQVPLELERIAPAEVLAPGGDPSGLGPSAVGNRGFGGYIAGQPRVLRPRDRPGGPPFPLPGPHAGILRRGRTALGGPGCGGHRELPVPYRR